MFPSFSFEARIIRKTIVTAPYNSNFEISSSIVVRTPIFVVGYWPDESLDEYRMQRLPLGVQGPAHDVCAHLVRLQR